MPPAFKGIIFDMDGTLTVPIIDFIKIRTALNIPSDRDLSEEINSRPEPLRSEGWQLIEAFEEEAARNNRFQPGAPETLNRFKNAGIRLGIITRNRLANCKILFDELDVSFEPVLTREFPFIKPSPEPCQHIIEQWGLEPHECLMVGDYVHDLECGAGAGTKSCFFSNPGKEDFSVHADYTVTTFAELEKGVFDKWTD